MGEISEPLTIELPSPLQCHDLDGQTKLRLSITDTILCHQRWVNFWTFDRLVSYIDKVLNSFELKLLIYIILYSIMPLFISDLIVLVFLWPWPLSLQTLTLTFSIAIQFCQGFSPKLQSPPSYPQAYESHSLLQTPSPDRVGQPRSSQTRRWLSSGSAVVVVADTSAPIPPGNVTSNTSQRRPFQELETAEDCLTGGPPCWTEKDTGRTNQANAMACEGEFESDQWAEEALLMNRKW